MRQLVAPLRLVIPVVLATILGAPNIAKAQWTPAPMTSNSPRVQLAMPEEAFETQPYAYVQMGDTLRFDFAEASKVGMEIHPVYESFGYMAYFRYGLEIESLGVELHKRYARVVGTGHARLVEGTELPEDIAHAFWVGEHDRVEVDIPRKPQRMKLWLRPSGAAIGAFVRVQVKIDDSYVEDEIAPIVVSEAPRVFLDADIGRLGYDSNPYRASTANGSIIGAAFYPVGISAKIQNYPDSAFRFDFGYDFLGRFYGNTILNNYRHSFRARQSWTPPSGSIAGRTRFDFDQRLRYRRKTFLARADGEEFDVVDDNSELVSLAERFNHWEVRLRAQSDTDFGKNISGRLMVSYRDRNYAQDYAQSPDIYALDYGAVAFGGQLGWKPSRRINLELGYQNESKAYDEKFTRELDGTERRDVPARYGLSEFSGRATVSLPQRLRVELVAARIVRTDRFEGYWNYEGWRVGGYVRKSWPDGHRLRLALFRVNKDYENAPVDFDAANPLKQKVSTKLVIDGRYRLNHWIDAEISVGYDERENNDPLFAYQRVMFVGGFLLRY